VLFVVIDTEALLADCHILTDSALVSRVINQLPIATCTTKSSFFGFETSSQVGLASIYSTHGHLGFLGLLSLSSLEFLLVLFQNLNSSCSPIGTAERALQRLSTAFIVFETPDQAVSVGHAPTPKPTVRQIFTLTHHIATHTASFIRIKRPGRD